MRPFTIFIVAVVGIIIYAAIPKTSETQTLTVACDVPDALAGTETGPLAEVAGIGCELADTTVVATSQFFGASTRSSTEASTARGSVAQLTGLIEERGAPLTPAQLAACLQLITDEIATTTAASAASSPEGSAHFRVSCAIGEDGTPAST
ncbi:hypothetical protein [Gymnodinialimonas sp.]